MCAEKEGENYKRIQKRAGQQKMGIVQGRLRIITGDGRDSVVYGGATVTVVWLDGVVRWCGGKRRTTLVEVLSQPADALAVALAPQHRAHVDLEKSFNMFSRLSAHLSRLLIKCL